MRYWGIRHARYAWHRLRLAYHLGLYPGWGRPSPEDLTYLDLLWKGHA